MEVVVVLFKMIEAEMIRGHLIAASADFYSEVTNSIAEAKALRQGLNLCCERNVNQVDIEVDSLMLVKVFKGEIATPWVMAYDVRGIKRILQQLDFSIQHTYRENDKAVDFLVNWGFKERKCLIFCSSNLPRKLVSVLRIDRTGFLI